MKKRNIVKENRDFNNIIGKRVGEKNHHLVVYYQENNKDRYRFGISVGTKVGNAVVRNHLKRQMRNIVDKHKKLYQNNKDYIIIIRKSCLGSSYQELETSFLNIIRKINNQEKEKNNAEK